MPVESQENFLPKSRRATVALQNFVPNLPSRDRGTRLFSTIQRQNVPKYPFDVPNNFFFVVNFPFPDGPGPRFGTLRNIPVARQQVRTTRTSVPAFRTC
jgi:hypothetical protein